jgi:hypothetical protein
MRQSEQKEKKYILHIIIILRSMYTDCTRALKLLYTECRYHPFVGYQFCKKKKSNVCTSLEAARYE